MDMKRKLISWRIMLKFSMKKIDGVDENFHINNVSKSDNVFIYGINSNRKTGLQHDQHIN